MQGAFVYGLRVQLRDDGGREEYNLKEFACARR
jgi:hypothetical protein